MFAIERSKSESYEKKNTQIFLAICKEFLLLCIEISETKHNPLHKPLYLFHFSYDYEHEFNKTGSVFLLCFNVCISQK